MVKHDNKWGTVCNDAFGSTEAQVACKTLGFSGGSYANGNIGIAESIVPIWMDDVDCDSSSTNFWNAHTLVGVSRIVATTKTFY